jgi:hypothetical protein
MTMRWTGAPFSEGISKGDSAGEFEPVDAIVPPVWVIRRAGGRGGAGFLLGDEIEADEFNRLDADKAGREVSIDLGGYRLTPESGGEVAKVSACTEDTLGGNALGLAADGRGGGMLADVVSWSCKFSKSSSKSKSSLS